MKKSAVITGAGTGVGRATAVALAKQGWRIALLGRSRETLDETARLTGAHADDVIAVTCDIGRADHVQAMAKVVLEKFPAVDALVNAAGTNAPKRAFEVLSAEDYHAMMDTNLNGPYYCIQAFLPQMRSRGSGTIINIAPRRSGFA